MTWGLSFDGGPALKFLEYLSDEDFPASFLIVAWRVMERPDILCTEYTPASGHLTAVHTWSHAILPTALTNEQWSPNSDGLKAIREVTYWSFLTIHVSTLGRYRQPRPRPLAHHEYASEHLDSQPHHGRAIRHPRLERYILMRRN
jgi:hypothetical protein